MRSGERPGLQSGLFGLGRRVFNGLQTSKRR
jgi:hypothetical protein